MINALNPMECYYTNDHYVSQISLTAREKQKKDQYSPKTLIKGYWKKDYSSIIDEELRQSKSLLPSIIKKKKPKKDSYSKLSEKILNISNCFENLPGRKLKTEVKIKTVQDKLTQITAHISKVHNHDKRKIPGRIFKGSLIRSNESSDSPVERKYLMETSKELLTVETLRDLSRQRTPMNFENEDQKERIPTIAQIEFTMNNHSDRVSSADIQYKQTQIIHVNEKQKKKQKQPSLHEKIRQNISPTYGLRQQIIVRKSTLNSKKLIMQIPPEIKLIKANNLICRYHKSCANNIQNVLVILFDGVLGFDEKSFFGYNFDFLGSQENEDYQLMRNYYFQHLCPNQDYYVIKNLKELFNSISRIYQIAIVVNEYTEQFINYFVERKIKVNGIFQIDKSTKYQTLHLEEILTTFRVKGQNKIIFIQPYDQSYKTTPIPNKKIMTYDYGGQSIYIPYVKDITQNHYRVLLTPILCMQTLFVNENYNQNKGYIHTNYFIEQFAFALQSETNFIEFTKRSQSKLRKITFEKYFRKKKQKILQKLHSIESLNQSSNLEQKKETKKSIIQNIIEKIGNKYETQITDLVYRNKKILKHMNNLQSHNINSLEQVHDELSDELSILNYCELFIDSFYYLQQ